MIPRVVVSARTVVWINGRRFGKATDFGFSISTGLTENRGIDSPVPYELAPGACRVSWTLQVLKVTMDGGAEGAGMTAPFEDLPNAKYFSFALIDYLTDAVLFKSDTNMVAHQEWRGAARGLVTGTIQATGIYYSNEVSALHQP